MKRISWPTGRPPTIDELVGWLKKAPHPSDRREAAWELSKHNNPYVVQLLIEALNDPEPDVRMAAADSLGELGHEPATVPSARQAVERLVALLEDEDEEVIGSAIDALGKLGDSSVAPKLLPFLDYPDSPRVKICNITIKALWRLRYQPVVPHLRRLLQSPQPGIRSEALFALLDFRHECDVNVQEILESFLNDPHPLLRSRAKGLLEIMAKEQQSKRQSQD